MPIRLSLRAGFDVRDSLEDYLPIRWREILPTSRWQLRAGTLGPQNSAPSDSDRSFVILSNSHKVTASFEHEGWSGRQ